MKKLLSLFVMALAFCVSAIGQVNPSTLWSTNWPVATTSGVVGGSGYYLNFDSVAVALGGYPISYTVDVYVTGTLPSVCTFEVQSSPDGVGWNTGAASLTGDQPCNSATVLTYSVFSKPDSDIRINIGTLTGADGTTQIHFFWRRASNVK